MVWTIWFLNRFFSSHRLQVTVIVQMVMLEPQIEKFRRWTWTNTINYNTTLAEKFNIGLLAVLKNNVQQIMVSGSKTNVTDPFFEDYQGAWVTAGMGGGGMGENYFISYFGRASFNYNKKYYIEGSVRRDGFSGLAKDNKFGTFWGASAMWNVSNESLFRCYRINLLRYPI